MRTSYSLTEKKQVQETFYQLIELLDFLVLIFLLLWT